MYSCNALYAGFKCHLPHLEQNSAAHIHSVCCLGSCSILHFRTAVLYLLAAPRGFRSGGTMSTLGLRVTCLTTATNLRQFKQRFLNFPILKKHKLGWRNLGLRRVSATILFQWSLIYVFIALIVFSYHLISVDKAPHPEFHQGMTCLKLENL